MMNDTNRPERETDPTVVTPAPDNEPVTVAPAPWQRNLPKWALWLSLAVLAWFALAAFGPKFGLIDWRTGLGFMIRDAGVILLAIAAVFALIALIASALKTPRGPWWKAALALAIPALLFACLAVIRAQADAAPPIHDVATDLRDPPVFSAQTMALRRAAGANPVNDYGTPLGELELWAGSDDTRLKGRNHADIIAENYDELRPIVLVNATEEEAFDAVIAAMGEIGLNDVHRVEGSNTVEGVAETFAFGFKDDVVARVENGQIDLRSVSRVGVSDLGYNAERLEDLREAILDRLGQ